MKTIYDLIEPEAKLYNYSTIAKAFDRKQTKVNLNKKLARGNQKTSTLSDFSVVTLTSLTNYTAQAINPITESAYLNVIGKILLREEKLLRLKDLIKCCTQKYFQYAVILVNQSLEVDSESIPTSRLSQYKDELIDYQKQLSSLIESYRDDTIRVIDAIQEWRSDYQNNHIQPSIMYKSQNYLIKMKNDASSLLNTHLIRIWIGVDSDCFVIPPLPYHPYQIWRSTYQSKFKEWVEYRTYAHSMAKLQQDSDAQKPTLLKRTSMKALVHTIASTRRRSVTSVALDALLEQRNTIVKAYTWEELMGICHGAWNINDLSPESFWLNYSLKADVVEAAIGYESIFPKKLIGTKSFI